jgi:hypothetical protein
MGLIQSVKGFFLKPAGEKKEYTEETKQRYDRTYGPGWRKYNEPKNEFKSQPKVERKVVVQYKTVTQRVKVRERMPEVRKPPVSASRMSNYRIPNAFGSRPDFRPAQTFNVKNMGFRKKKEVK